ncbi:hypothetical protein [Serratia microhaemolytica]|uniref:hypothetical protein n=1 Tax=Serratia microhaemolytica TaxID=2675110 RepID=UPI000FDE22EC|nr:hypothetical protein [Serratia microhaemolytica]
MKVDNNHYCLPELAAVKLPSVKTQCHHPQGWLESPQGPGPDPTFNGTFLCRYDLISLLQ